MIILNVREKCMTDDYPKCHNVSVKSDGQILTENLPSYFSELVRIQDDPKPLMEDPDIWSGTGLDLGRGKDSDST